MNKNLKKVISAVAALAISASAVSALAVNFPDVADDASYATAVQELSSLDIISGFEDGTFRPDELVTRAQITKMIVDALAEREQAEASKANSQFNDVSTDHWAKGYINQGVADKFIAGYSSTEFGPDDNVTYVQAQKMLVCAIGYETYAVGNGGWPNGYKQWASSTGITDGISGLTDDTQLTRAQVAQLIDNAMDAPVCVISGWNPQWNGTQTPILDIKNKHDDDDATDYQTLFTLKHDAYKFYGRVQKTSRTDSLNNDEVELSVEKSENFDNDYVSSKYEHDPITAKVGDTNAADYLLTYAEVLVQKDSNDEFTILSINAAAATSGKVVTLAAEDFDYDKTAKNAPANWAKATKFYFGKNEKYTVDPFDDTVTYRVYVNGKERTDLEDSLQALAQYIDEHDTAAVTFEKQAKPGSTNTTTDYTLVSISDYETAVVSGIIDKTSKVTINLDGSLKSSNLKGKNSIVIDFDNEDLTYSITLDGVEIEPSAIQENDVLSIAYDTTDEGKLEDSEYYDIIVSRDVLEGVSCSSVGGDPTEWTIDGTKYRAAAGFDDDPEEGKFADLKASSSTYNVYLDHFGRIAKVEEDSSTKNIAILKNVYQKRGGDWMAQIITKSGVEEEHKVKNADEALALQKVLVDKKTVAAADPEGVDYNNNDKAEKYVQQVIEYKLNSSDQLSFKANLSADADTKVSGGTIAALTAGDYRESTDTIGGKIDVNENSVILDLSDVDRNDSMKVVSASTLKDSVEYKAVGYDPTTSGDTYHRFIILTSGGNIFGYDSQLSVVKSTSKGSVDGTDIIYVTLFTNGDDDEVTYAVDEDATVKNYVKGSDGKYAVTTYDEADLKEGDVIVYTLDADKYITDLRVINTKQFADYGTKFNDFEDDVKDGTAFIPDIDDWHEALFEDSDSDNVKVLFGAVVNQKGNKVTISQVEEKTVDGKTVRVADITAGEAINYASAKIYAYDFSASTKNGASKVTPNYGIVSTPDRTEGKVTIDGDVYLNLDDEASVDDVVYAIARVDGSKALEIILFVDED